VLTLRRGLAAAAGVGLLAALVLLVARHPAPRVRRASPPPATGAVQFGANVGPLFNGEPYATPQVDAQLAALAATGAQLARSDAPWEASEPQPPSGGVHRYDWAFDDRVAGALAAHRLRWLAIIDYSAPWAQSVPGQDHSPPSSPADFAAYAAAFAQRYGAHGSFWAAHPTLPAEPVDTYEIWNEPDSPVFWYPQPDLARYAVLYLQARAAIRAVQPDARVIVGGLAHPQSSIPALLAADPALRGQLDGVGIHPYGPDPAAVLAGVRAARAALDAQGLSAIPLYVTEFGWTTRPPGALGYAPESQRPAYVEQTLAELGHLHCGLAAVLLYAWVTTERSPTDANDWYGIASPTGLPTPDVRAFAAGLRAAATAGPPLSCG